MRSARNDPLEIDDARPKLPSSNTEDMLFRDEFIRVVRRHVSNG